MRMWIKDCASNDEKYHCYDGWVAYALCRHSRGFFILWDDHCNDKEKCKKCLEILKGYGKK